MRRVYKYPLSLETEQRSDIVKDAEILKIGFQGPVLTMWCLVDPAVEETEPMHLRIFGTGWNIDEFEFLMHLETVFQGPYVWHIFEDWREGAESV